MKKVSETKLPKSKSNLRPRIKAGESAARAFAAASKCPALAHWVGREHGAPFDHAQSQVLDYLTGDPDIRLWLFRAFYRSGAIVYDAGAGKWRGREVSS
jgi:hypothetical protein